MCMSLRVYVVPHICPLRAHAPSCACPLMCMSSMCMYVPPCVCRSVYVSSCVCPSMCMSFRVLVPSCLLHVHVPLCVCLPCVCCSVYVSSCVCPFMLRAHAPSWACSLMCMPSMCMSLLVYVSPCFLYACPLRVHVPLSVCRSMCTSLRVYDGQGTGSLCMYSYGRNDLHYF